VKDSKLIDSEVFNAIYKDRYMTVNQSAKVRDRVMKIIKQLMAEHLLALADAQLIGYHAGKWDGDILALVDAMGLTKSEWNKLKRNYSISLDDEDKKAINKYFKEQ